jgi:CRP/FNR family transcriptional regulator
MGIIPELFSNAPDSIIQEFETKASLQSIPAGTEISREGDACHYFPIVEKGVIRVYKISKDGHEVTLYRIRQAESCVLTLSCLMRSAQFPAHAVVEAPSDVWLVPADVFRSWTAEQAFWREYVISALSRTLNRVVGLVDEMLFRSVELRIIDSLLAQSSPADPVLHCTHQDLANEVGSAREVISRNLKELEREGFLSLLRSEIRILDREGLLRRSELL